MELVPFGRAASQKTSSLGGGDGSDSDAGDSDAGAGDSDAGAVCVASLCSGLGVAFTA